MDNYNIKTVAPLLMVNNIQTSLEFYSGGLGFQVLNTWKPNGKFTWCWLQREGAALMLQEYSPNDQRRGSEKGIGVALWFQCTDALTLYHEFLAKGITPNEPFVGNNLWDVALTDPDNYSIHFESPTDVPEETTYGEWISKKM
jgi:lactoylglutathione lyase